MRPYEQREFTIGSVVGESLTLYRRFFLRFFLVAVLVYAVVGIPTAMEGQASSDRGRAIWLAIALIVDIVGFALVQGALVDTVDDVRDGKLDSQLGDVYDRARRRVPQIVGLAFLLGVIVGVLVAGLVVLGAVAHVTALGIVVALVLALFLLTRWAVAMPVVMLEDIGPWSAMNRSYRLVDGHSFRVFWTLVVSGIMAGVLSLIVTGILRAIVHGFIGTWLGSAIASGVTAPFIAIVGALMYFHLRPLAAPAPA